MSAFSQASMIHVNDPDFEKIRDFFMENFCLHTSTSPQYPMIASLDVARKQMVMEGYSLLSRALKLSDSLKKAINSLKKFRVLEVEDIISDEIRDDNIKLDRTKITIDISKSGFSSKEVEHLLLCKHDIQIEKSTFNTITILITIGSTQSKINRLFLALENLELLSGNIVENKNGIMSDFKLALSPIKFKPRYAYYCDGEHIHLGSTRGKICTSMVVPYPPGIPLLVPGQLITEEIIQALQTYREYNVEIHGLHDGMVKVMTEEEETDLTRRGYTIKDLSEADK
jgi:arginine/lysine/ornithine decarboxylase